MRFFQLKPLQAVTFDEFVQFGLAQEGANIVDGAPWAFTYNGCPVTQETPDRYLLGPAARRVYFYRGQILVSGPPGLVEAWDADWFAAKYEEVLPTLLQAAGTK